MNTYITTVNIVYIIVSVLYILYGADNVLSFNRKNNARTKAMTVYFVSLIPILLGLFIISTNWYLLPPVTWYEVIFLMMLFIPFVFILNFKDVWSKSQNFIKILSSSYIIFFVLYIVGIAYQENYTYLNKFKNNDMTVYYLDYIGFDGEKKQTWISYKDKNGYCKRVYIMSNELTAADSFESIDPKDWDKGPYIISIPDNHTPKILTLDSISNNKLRGSYIFYAPKDIVEWMYKNTNIKFR